MRIDKWYLIAMGIAFVVMSFVIRELYIVGLTLFVFGLSIKEN